MMGMDYLRLNRLLARRGPLPRHTNSDVLLFRFIAWGAVAYFALTLIGYAIYSRFISNEAVFLGFIVIPAAVLLLICWWTCDLAPRFARSSILLVSAIIGLVSILFAFGVDVWAQIQLVALAAYCWIVGSVSSRQLRAIRKHDNSLPPDGHGAA